MIQTPIQRIAPIRTSENDYPVIILGDPSREYPLPGRPGFIRRDEIKKHENVIVLGERSGGVRDCLGWWWEVLEGEGEPWAFVHGAEWKSSLILTSSGQPAGIEKAIERIGSLEKASEKADALVDLAKMVGHDGKGFSLIVRDFAALGESGSEAFAEAFRMIRDLKRCPNLRLVVGSDSESYFADDVFSGLLSMSYRYRLMPFNGEEILKLFGTLWRPPSDRIDTDGLDEVLNVTGGQPILAKDLLGRLEPQGSGKIGRKEIRNTYRAQRRSPPGVTRLWKEELRKLLKERAELVDPLRRYVSGATLGPSRFPPPSDERPLLVGGWLRLNHLERWGISSEMHADLARDVLDRL